MRGIQQRANQANNVEMAKVIYSRLASDTTFFCALDGIRYRAVVLQENHRLDMADLSKIEEFVHAVVSNTEPAFRLKEDETGAVKVESLLLARYLPSAVEQANKYMYRKWPDIRFSAYVDVFIASWSMLDLDKRSILRSPSHPLQPCNQRFEAFNDFISLVRAKVRKPRVRAALYQRNKTSLRGCANVEKFLRTLFDRYARLYVLEIDFGYRASYAKQVTAGLAKGDLKRFLNCRRSKPVLFSACAGYFWKLLYRDVSGYVFRLFLLYAGKEPRDSLQLSDQIGRYWKNEITLGCGIYCVRPSLMAERVGLFDEEDSDRNHDLTYRYLVAETSFLMRSDEYLQAACLIGERCFGKGAESNLKRPAR